MAVLAVLIMVISHFVVLRSPDGGQLDGGTNDLFIGGLSADLSVPNERTMSRDYIGCMRDLFVNGNHVQLAGDEDQQSESHNVKEGCDLGRSTQSCAAGCRMEGCIDFLNDTEPYCDCVVPSANCSEDG